MGKITRQIGQRGQEKKFDDIFNRLDASDACNRQTDWQTPDDG